MAHASVAKAKKIPYTLHPSYKMVDSARKTLLEKTGRTFETWIAFAKKMGPKDLKERRAWLMNKHGLGTNYAWWVADGDNMSPDTYDPEGYVTELFSGTRAASASLYELVARQALSFGDDVKVCPCQTMVPLYRKFVFAELRPVSGGALEVGLALGTQKAAGRLESLDHRAVGNRITHRVVVQSAKDLDVEVKGLLRKAYEKGDQKADRAPGVSAGAEAKVPPDLAKALKPSPAAQATWKACTPRMRADWITWIENAAKAETRAKRIGTTVTKLAAGKKKAY